MDHRALPDDCEWSQAGLVPPMDMITYKTGTAGAASGAWTMLCEAEGCACCGICIIDDDAAVRDALASLLDAYGYRTLSFARCEEYLALAWPADIGCIILDPHRQGEVVGDAIAALCRSGRPIPVVVMARTLKRPPPLPGNPEIFHLLEKPFPPEQLLGVVAAAIEAHATKRIT